MSFVEPKRAMLTEELVALTGDYRPAIILHQLLYWTKIKFKADKLLAEELSKAERLSGPGCEPPSFCPSYGWVYMSAQKLSEQTMLGLAPSNIRKYLKQLVADGYLFERNNPNIKWDKEKQYRLNLSLLKENLEKIGYRIETLGIMVKTDEHPQNGIMEEYKTGTSIVQNEKSAFQNEKAITEITLKTRDINILSGKPDDTPTSSAEKKKKDGGEIAEIVDYLNEKAGKHYKTGTQETKTCIKARMREGFTVEDFKRVIDKQVRDWKGTKYEEYLRPTTLFGNKFEGYLNKPDKPNKPEKGSVSDLTRGIRMI